MNKKTIILFFLLLILLAIFGCTACSNKDVPANKTVFISFNANGGTFLVEDQNQPTLSFQVRQGDSIILPSSPTKEGYVFIDWYLSLDFKETDRLNLTLFKAVESKTIFAKWESVETYPHIIAIGDYQPVAIISANKERASMGETVSLDISYSDYGYRLKEGSLMANDIPIDESTFSFVMPSSEVFISAVFELRPFDINVINEEYLDGKILLGARTAKRGEIVSFYAIPKMGYKVESITILNNGEPIIGNSFIMGAFDTNINVSFSKIDLYDQFKIEKSQYPNADINCSKNFASPGEYVYFDVVSDQDFFVESVFANEIQIYENGFIMPFKNVTLSATIKEINYSEKYQLTLSQQPFPIGSQIVKIEGDKEYFSEGEKIELDISALSDYVIDSVAINGVFMQLDRLFMPKNDAVMTVEVAYRGKRIYFHEESTVNVSLSHEYALENELIKISLLDSLEGKKFSFKYWEYPNGNEIFTFYDQYSFIMPDYDICFRSDIYEISSEKRSIEYQISGEGVVANPIMSAAYNEVISLTLIPNEEQKNAIKSIYYYEDSKKIDIFEIISPIIGTTTCSFSMPNYEIILYVVFERYYTIRAFENEKLSIYPDKEYAFEGDLVFIDIQARNNYNLAQATVTVSGNDLDVSGYYLVGNVDLELAFREISISQVSYTIKYFYPEQGGMIKGQNSAKVGSYVPLEVNSDKGYILSSLMIKKASDPDSNYKEIPDTFIMPDYNVYVKAEFEQSTPESFSLRERYLETKDIFLSKYGIFLKRIDNLTSILNYFQDFSEICSFSHYLEEVIIAEKDEGSFYLIIEVNLPILVNSLGQIFDKIYSSVYSAKTVDIQIFSNLIVLSVEGSAKDDYYSFKNGLIEIENSFWVYENEDGTYSTYKYFGDKSYVVIPRTVKVNTQNSRIVSCIGKNTFKDIGNIKGLALSYVRNLADFSLSYDKLDIEELDLSQVIEIGEGSLSGLEFLKKYYLASDNSKYSIDTQNVLYSKNKDILVSYPAGKEENLFIVPSTCTKIGDYAFYGADNLFYIRFQASNKIGYIGIESFAFCTSLIQIDLTGEETYGSANISAIATTDLFISNRAFFEITGINEYYLPQIKRLGENVITWDGSSNLEIYLVSQDMPPTIIALPVSLPEEIIFNTLSIFIKEESYQRFISDSLWSNFQLFFVQVAE